MTTAVQLPVPALRDTSSGRSAYAVLWPQRWGFFADAADAPVVVAYVHDGTGLVPEPVQRHLSARNLWGLRRASDALQDEIAYLTSLVPGGIWAPCAAPDPAGCPVPRHPAYPLVNDYSAPRLCGRVVLAVLGPETRDAAGGRIRTHRPVIAVAGVRSRCPER